MAVSDTLDKKLAVPALRIMHFLDKFPKFHNIYVIALVSCISGMMFGFDISSMSAFIGTDQYANYFHSPDSALQGFITSAMALGSFFGSIAASFISEPLGRRITLIGCSFFWSVGAAIQSSSQNRAQLIIGRIISGLGVGLGTTTAPVYLAELSPRKVRGFIGGMFQFNVTLGIMIMFFISYGLHFINGVASFRIAWGIQIIPGLMLYFLVFLLPESPRWLAKHEYWDAAQTVVEKVHSHGYTEEDVQIEMSEIKEQIIIEEATTDVTYATLFNKRYFPRTITAIFAQIWQQLTGMNVMMYYIVYIFDMAGYSGNTNLISSAIQYVLNTVTTIPALFLLDKVGRRKILLTGAVFMMIFQFAVAGILADYSEPISNYAGSSSVTIQIPADRKPAARGVIACCYLFVCSFAPSWGVGIWLYCSEIWGDHSIRQRGAALSTAANWIINFAIAMYTPSSFENISWKTYCIYATFCACMFIHVFFGFPETKGRTLEEIGQIWDQKIPAWKSASWVPHTPLLPGELSPKQSASHDEKSVQHDDESSGVAAA